MNKNTNRRETPRNARNKRGVVYADPTRGRRPPAGCVDVWQIQSRHNAQFSYHGVFRDFDVALNEAIRLNDEMRFQHHFFTLAHKAAIQIGERFHLVHFDYIRFKEPTQPGEQPAEPEAAPDDDGNPW